MSPAAGLSEAELGRKLALYQSLFANMHEGFALGEVILNARGKPTDYRLLEVNDAFYRHTGLTPAILGRPSVEWAPRRERAWLEQLTSIALGGQARRFQNYNVDTDRHYEISGYCPERGRFALLCRDISDHLRAEEIERNRSNELQQIIVGLPGMVWTATPNGVRTYISPQWSSYIGAAHDRLDGDGWVATLHPDDQEPARLRWARAVATGTLFTSEHRIRRHDGVYRWFSARGLPLCDDTGRICRWFGICTDVDDLKQAQEAHKSAEQSYTSLFNNELNGISHSKVITDADGRPVDFVYLRINKGYERILGIRREDMEGRRFTDAFPGIGEGENNLISRYGNIALHGGEEKFEYFLEATGQWLSVYTYSPRRGECTSIFCDITAQKRAEFDRQKLLEELSDAAFKASAERAKLDALLQALDAGIATFDLEGRLVMSNQAFLDINDISDADLSEEEQKPMRHYQNSYEVTLPDGTPLGFEQWPVVRAIRGETFRDMVVHCRRRDSSVVKIFNLSGRPLFDDNGRQIMGITVQRDITEQKRLQEHAIELRAARQSAEAANRAKTQLLTNLSREIRTPLNALVGFNGLLLTTPLSEEQRRYAEQARLSGETLLHLLNDFLDFTRAQAGKLELEPVPFDITQLCNEQIHQIEFAARAKQLDLVCEIASNVPRALRGDAARLRQVLANLLSNAVKFTETGSVALHCDLVVRDDQYAVLRLSVSDTGMGVSEKTLARMFEPFTDVDAATARHLGGTGLGLAISRNLVTLMGGHIDVQSREGQGSTFSLELPFEILPPDVELEPSFATGQAECAPGERGRVLLVEDNLVNQRVIGRMLESLGCLVDVAADGREAVRAVRTFPYDMVFMDCQMPVMDGYEATRTIRSAGYRALPIVAVTASVRLDERQRCLDAGMNDYMPKPVRRSDLRARLDQWLPVEAPLSA